ncbi:MAG: hypothetical protein Athens041674_53 [Parcubacteria group bacterium Athens0416_74]|nr:MAG: hypothetical protein Athens041674_53 [Parcubacteria group bacterium Athens0416_74]
MIDRDVISRILHAGVQAPSGDNSQPWSFKIDGDAIIVLCHPQMDHPVLNVDARGTYLATGALIENMVIAARHEGLDASVRYFERDGETARMVLSYGSEKGHHLYPAIANRHTHRGAYETPLDASSLELLTVETEEHCRMTLITKPAAIRRIAEASTLMEETALSIKKLHYLFFKSLLWSVRENESGTPGLFIKTTELPAPVQGMFRVIRHWPLMRIFHVLGLPKAAAKSNAEVYASSGAIAALFVTRTEPQDFIAAGRCMQRIWLSATHAGLSAQPLAGLIYLAEYVARTDDQEIGAELKQRIRAARKVLSDTTEERGDTMAMMLRIGIPKQHASSRSKRRPPVIL